MKNQSRSEEYFLYIAPIIWNNLLNSLKTTLINTEHLFDWININEVNVNKYWMSINKYQCSLFYLLFIFNCFSFLILIKNIICDIIIAIIITFISGSFSNSSSPSGSIIIIIVIISSVLKCQYSWGNSETIYMH